MEDDSIDAGDDSIDMGYLVTLHLGDAHQLVAVVLAVKEGLLAEYHAGEHAAQALRPSIIHVIWCE